MYSCSATLSQISLKNSFGKVVFQILAKIKMTQNKNRLLGRHFETEQHCQFFFAELWFFVVHTYMVQISLQNSGGKVVFQRCNFRKSRFFTKSKNLWIFKNVQKSPKNLPKKKEKIREKKKKIIGNSFHREGFFQPRISIANIVFNRQHWIIALMKNKHVCALLISNRPLDRSLQGYLR